MHSRMSRRRSLYFCWKSKDLELAVIAIILLSRSRCSSECRSFLAFRARSRRGPKESSVCLAASSSRQSTPGACRIWCNMSWSAASDVADRQVDEPHAHQLFAEAPSAPPPPPPPPSVDMSKAIDGSFSVRSPSDREAAGLPKPEDVLPKPEDVEAPKLPKPAEEPAVWRKAGMPEGPLDCPSALAARPAEYGSVRLNSSLRGSCDQSSLTVRTFKSNARSVPKKNSSVCLYCELGSSRAAMECSGSWPATMSARAALASAKRSCRCDSKNSKRSCATSGGTSAFWKASGGTKVRSCGRTPSTVQAAKDLGVSTELPGSNSSKSSKPLRISDRLSRGSGSIICSGSGSGGAADAIAADALGALRTRPRLQRRRAVESRPRRRGRGSRCWRRVAT
mmetsp:Transcript_98937/g.317247  ORF Transcript_98937/g.317247 Transcript_98937/m.317247 type:complete len:394 (-) Transcript_98937:779-1960(-)